MDIPCSMGCHEPDKNGYCIWCNRKVAEGVTDEELIRELHSRGYSVKKT
jgi:hypothetical protein